MNILVIAAHPDDEVLGMGATIKKLSKKNKIYLCVVSEGATAQYDNKKMIKVRRDSCLQSSKLLGISNVKFLDFPDQISGRSIVHLEINKELEKMIKIHKPKVVYTTPSHDLNKDHQLIFDSTLVATRPYSSSVKQLLSYEIHGLVKQPFCPTVYENVEKEFSYKLKAFKMYKSEIMNFPHPRSIKAIESLAMLRGTESGLKKAEAFQLIRNIID
jgi:LmbE family N-acetylglucosaminyl deacetylase